MKEWLSDIKNRPIIIGIAAFVLVAAVVGALFGMGIIGGGTAAPDATTATVPATTVPAPAAASAAAPSSMQSSASSNLMAPGVAHPAPRKPARPAMAAKPILVARPGLPGKPGAVAPPGAPGVAGKPVTVASVNIGKQDPYLPAYSVAKLRPPPPNLFTLVRPGQVASLPSIRINNHNIPIIGPASSDVQLGQVAGIIFSNGVHAIYEANGEATIVQPGDMLPDGQGRVTSIGPASMAVKVAGDRTINIPITSGTIGGSGQSGNPAAAQAPDQGAGEGDDTGA